MINFTRAFDSAWERMHIILFRPFDFGKWLAIGLSAFLAGLLSGGNGVNGSFNSNNFNPSSFGRIKANQTTTTFNFHQFNNSVSHAISGLQAGIIIVLVLVALLFIFAILLLVYWLGSRGQFMLLDNIVRNRGAISWPWQYYSRLANSLLGFYLLLILLSMALFLPILGVAAVMAIPLFQQKRWPEGAEIAGFVALGLVYFALVVVFSFVLFIFREFGIPLMFRNGLLARAAFVESMNLFRRHTASIVVFVLLRMAIFIGIAVLSAILCCVTCCIAMLPYIGTVFLLPVIVYVRCFTLDCLAQFGPEYDVWTVDVAPPGAPGLQPLSPQPPPG